MVIYGGRSGKPMDYVAWAKAAHPSVSGALVQPHALGIGTVLVRPICNELVNRLPTQAVLDAIAAYYPSVSPATSDWRLATPLLHPVTIDVQLSPEVDTAENRLNITAFLSDLVLSKVSDTAVLLQTDIDVAILAVTSNYVRLAPAANITAAAGEIFVLNPVVFS
jgi:hypothetical protein